jgi:hypothetical protein
MNDDLKTIWKKRLWPNFKVLSQHLPGETEENTENLSQGSWSRGRELISIGEPLS